MQVNTYSHFSPCLVPVLEVQQATMDERQINRINAATSSLYTVLLNPYSPQTSILQKSQTIGRYLQVLCDCTDSKFVSKEIFKYVLHIKYTLDIIEEKNKSNAFDPQYKVALNLRKCRGLITQISEYSSILIEGTKDQGQCICYAMENTQGMNYISEDTFI